jgi:pimeloyl-ACP methyl ester carboxylesterase
MWNYRLDYDTLAGDLAAVLQALDLRQAMLVNHSTGAGEMVRYLTRCGAAHVSRVALIAPAATPYPLKSADNPDGIEASFFESFETASC